MKVVVGLGNPGPEYQGTRHNAGMMLVDKLAERLASGYGWRKEKEAMLYKADNIWLVKTGGRFMNESGVMVRRVVDFYKLAVGDVYLAHDDLDIKLGEYKIQLGIGPKEHNGVKSVEQALGTKDFRRVRMGIENRQLPISGEEYVLQRFLPEEREVVERVMEEVVQKLVS